MTDIPIIMDGFEMVAELPEQITDGRWLIHNHIRPAHPIGMNGFRAYLAQPDAKRFEPCDCGWAAELGQHYRFRREQLSH